MPIEIVSDWRARLLGRLYEQFKGKLRLVALAGDVCAPQFQDLESAFQSLLTIMSIDDSEGVQLDVIGRLVGQPRAGTDDATYRPYLRARIRANRSNGTPEDLYAVLVAMRGDPTPGTLIYTPGGHTDFAIRIVPAITPAAAGAAVSFVRDAKDAGARAIVEWQETDDADAFTTALGYGITAGVAPGAVTIVLDGYAGGFPIAGYVTLDPGLAAEETVAFTSTLAGPEHLAVTVANAHGAGAFAQFATQAGSPLGPGKGFDDLSNPGLGGALAGALQA